MINEFIDMLNDFFDRRMRDIMIGGIGAIQSYDKESLRADVLPLLSYSARGNIKAGNFSVIPGMPVLTLHAGDYVMIPPYKKDDLVWMTFSTFPIANSLSGSNDQTDGSIFSRESGAVVCGLAKNGWNKPSFTNKDGLIMGHKSGNCYMMITENTVEIKGDLTISGDVVADSENNKISLIDHPHVGNLGALTSPPE